MLNEKVTIPIGLGSVGAIPVAFTVWVIGLSLGGTTGYAINPARDLAPRFMHTVLPIKDKGDSQWSYSWGSVDRSASGIYVGRYASFDIAGLIIRRCKLI